MFNLVQLPEVFSRIMDSNEVVQDTESSHNLGLSVEITQVLLPSSKIGALQYRSSTQQCYATESVED